MSTDSASNSPSAQEAKHLHYPDDFYVLYLYIAGTTGNSHWAIKQLENICAQYLPERHEIRIIDVHKNPEIAESDHIVATPTLIKKLPPPLRKFIGDLTDRESILIGLDIW